MSDLLVSNAHLVDSAYDGDSFIRVSDGTIRDVGPMSSAPRGVVELDAAGRTVLPGFIDSHVHAVEAGIEMLRCDMSDCATTESLLARIRSYAEQCTPGQWIVGRGWDPALLGEGQPTLDELDAATLGLPAYLNSSSGHIAIVNREALRRSSVADHTADPAGGILGRDREGRLDGVMYEAAMGLVESQLPDLTPAERRAGLLASQSTLFSLGVTSWQEAIVGAFVRTTDVYDTYVDAAQHGELTAKVNGALWWPRVTGFDGIQRLIQQRESLGDGRFRCHAVKIMHDGSLASQTAALTVPYRDGSTGTSFYSLAELCEIVRACDEHGFDVHIHTNGDSAIDDALEAIERAMKANSPRDRRHQLAHVAILRDDQIERMARLQVIAVVQPFWAHHSARMAASMLPTLPEELHSMLYRFGSLVAAGVPTAFSSDWPVTTADPLRAIHVALTRRSSEEVEPRAFGAREALSLSDALRSASEVGAFALRREHEIGQILPGSAADLVVVGDRISRHSVPPESSRIDHTIVDGEVVFSR